MHSSGADSFVTWCVLRCSVKSHSKMSLMVGHRVKLQYLLFPWQPWWCLIHFVSGVLKCPGWLETKWYKRPIFTFACDYIWGAKTLSAELTDSIFVNVVVSFKNVLGSFFPANIGDIDDVKIKPFLVSFHRFYSSPYSISTNRMIAQTSITPFIAASPVSTYQVGGPSLGFAGFDHALKPCKASRIW